MSELQNQACGTYRAYSAYRAYRAYITYWACWVYWAYWDNLICFTYWAYKAYRAWLNEMKYIYFRLLHVHSGVRSCPSSFREDSPPLSGHWTAGKKRARSSGDKHFWFDRGRWKSYVLFRRSSVGTVLKSFSDLLMIFKKKPYWET